MVVDTSALLAVHFQEQGWKRFEGTILNETERRISTVSRLEAAMVAESRGAGGRIELEELIDVLDLETIPFDRTQLELAIAVFRRYGKGRHPAVLNLGDCCSYALAKAMNEPLPFKGADFSQTDIQPAATG